jgi:hypothetical protein
VPHDEQKEDDKTVLSLFAAFAWLRDGPEGSSLAVEPEVQVTLLPDREAPPYESCRHLKNIEVKIAEGFVAVWGKGRKAALGAIWPQDWLGPSARLLHIARTTQTYVLASLRRGSRLIVFRLLVGRHVFSATISLRTHLCCHPLARNVLLTASICRWCGTLISHFLGFLIL